MTAAGDGSAAGSGAASSGKELVLGAPSGVTLLTGSGTERAAASNAAPVATQTAAIGIITPPPEIRSIVDKTAQFVARNGPEFEKRILANERNNVKFNFLLPGDPYHAYYQHTARRHAPCLPSRMLLMHRLAAQVAAFKAEEAGGAAPKLQAITDAQRGAEQEAPEKVAVQTATNFKPVVLEAPEKEFYTVPLPDGISAFDLDVIKLTAQFVARNGKGFLTGLTSREHMNAQFNFLKPTHSMFSFFTALADAYSKVLMPSKSLAQRLHRDAEDKAAVLDRCLRRLEWERSQERARKEAEDKAEAERDAMAAIDWHDFVVVETIDFYTEEDESLPAPLTLMDVIAQLRNASIDAAAPAETEAEMEVEMDEEERTLVAEHAAVAAPPPAAPEPMMKIVRNYKRPGAAAAGAAATDSLKFVVSPITGELVPVDQMAEHMRISLIDPKWREQKEIMMGKLRGSTVASDEEIAKNVIYLARTRPDIFGSTDEEVSAAVTAEVEAKSTAPAEPPAAVPPSFRPPMAHSVPPGVPLPPPPLPSLPGAPGAALPVGSAGAPSRPLPAPMPMQGRPYGAPQVPPGAPPGASMGFGGPAFFPPHPAAMPPRPPGAPPLPFAQPPMPPPYGMPLPGAPGGMPGAPGVPVEEPDAKRQKKEEALLSEEDFAEAHPDPVTIDVVVPDVDGDASLNGQTVTLEVASVMETVGDVKARLANAIGVPASKQKMSTQALGFLKDTSTLAAYNFGSGTVLIMGLKERGGRTKK